MAAPSASTLANAFPLAAAVGVTSSQVLGPNVDRAGLLIDNTDTVATVSLIPASGGAAVLNGAGTITLPPGKSILLQNLKTSDAFNAIASAAASISLIEFGAPSVLTPPATALSGATHDLDFARGNYYNATPSSITFTRASPAMAPDATGFWYNFDAGVPRIISGPQGTGFWIEQQVAHLMRNNTMQGAALGTIGAGGAYPTNWLNQSGGGANPAGLTVTISRIGTFQNIDIIEINWQGTPNASTQIRLSTEVNAPAAGNIPAVQNNNFAHSAFVQLVGGDLTNIGQLQLLQQYRDNTGVSVTTGAVNFTPTTAFQRFQGTSQATGAATASVTPEIGFSVTNGQPINMTLRIGLPQLEPGVFATTPIRTLGAAVTRQADVAILSLLFGSAFSLYAEGRTQALQSGIVAFNPRLASISDGTTTNVNRLLNLTSTGRMNNELRVGGVQQFADNLTAGDVTGANIKAASAVQRGYQAGACNGGAAVTHAGASIFVPIQAVIGADGDGASSWSGPVRRLALNTARAWDAAYLQQITAP